METQFVNLELDNGILIFTYKPEIELTLDVVKNAIEARLKFTEGKSYPVLIKYNDIKGINREAREFLSSPEGVKGVIAGALLSNSVFNAFLGNFFIRVTVINPPVPTKLFNDEAKALKWLEQYKDKVL